MPSDSSTQAPVKPAQTQFYQWQGYSCAYEVRMPLTQESERTPLLLIHPIGVGLSRRFWDRFAQEWLTTQANPNPLYIPDLLGCGESDMPRAACTPDDWAAQLQQFVQTVVQQPVVLLVQGALLPVAIALTQRLTASNLVRGLILAGPPAWPLITQATPAWQQKLVWNLLDSPLGDAFYRYARRRRFLESFSVRQLFADAEAVDDEWLKMLRAGAQRLESRYAVFSFLAGFWRQNYEQAITSLNLPTLVVIGSQASSISRQEQGSDPSDRLADYIRHIPRAQGMQISGRNVLPYEGTEKFVTAIAPFVQQFIPD